MSEYYDVIIIGGGLAGLSTAVNITKGNVILLDKDKIKTEEKRYLRFSLIKDPRRFGYQNCVLNQYNTLLLQSISGAKLKIHFEDFEIKLLDLGKIKKILKKEVEKKSEIREQTEVKDVKFNKNKIEIKITNGYEYQKLIAKYLIDASGACFFTRKIFNLDIPNLLCKCFSASFIYEYSDDPNTMTFIMPANNSRCGGWIFPFDNKKFHYGIADLLNQNGKSPNNLKKIFYNTLKHPIFKDMINKYELKKWDIGTIPIGFKSPLIKNRVIYIGDSVAQVTPWLIEGIRPISEASIICANAIDEIFKNKDKSFLKKYEDIWNSTYGQVYSKYNHYSKWNRKIFEWDESLTRMSKIVNTLGKTIYLELLRYDKMSKKNRNLLKKLQSNISQV